MRRPAPANEDQILRLGTLAAGVLLMTSAWLAGDLALEHMAAIGTICGAGPGPHCGWCLGAAGLALAGLAALALAWQGGARPGRPALARASRKA